MEQGALNDLYFHGFISGMILPQLDFMFVPPTNDFCHEHQALTFEMEDVRDPSAEAQLADASLEFPM